MTALVWYTAALAILAISSSAQINAHDFGGIQGSNAASHSAYAERPRRLSVAGK
jgi:hypothetical protein